MAKEKNKIVDGISKHVKRVMIKKLLVWIAPAVPFVMLAIVILIVILGPAITLKEQYESFKENMGDFFNFSSRVGMETLIDEVGKGLYGTFPIEKNVLKRILEAEDESYYNDIVIKAPIRVETTELVEVPNYILVNGVIKIGTPAVRIKEETTTDWEYYDLTLKYYEATYEFRTPWQLIYSLAIGDSFKSNLDDIILQYEDAGYDIEKSMYLVDLKKLEKAIDVMRPSYNFTVNPEEVKAGKAYTYEELSALSDSVLNREITTSTLGKGKRVTRTKYSIEAVPKEMANYSEKKTYHYKTKTENGKVCTVIDYIEADINYQKFDLAMEEMGYTNSDLGYFMLLLENMPEGEVVLYKMSPIASSYGVTGYNTFTSQLPTIVGAWSRSDLIDMSESLLGLWYFYGAKYPKYGVSNLWGSLAKQNNRDSAYYGDYLPMGLDCSGFVDWVYYQMLGEAVGTGGGSVQLFANSTVIRESELRPGDLGFYQYGGGKHVGIYWGKIDGVNAFIHAGGSTWKDEAHPYGQVIITKQYESYNGYPGSKFKYFARLPITFIDDYLYEE